MKLDPDEVADHIGDQIRFLREHEESLTQDELAERLDWTISAVSRFESGENDPTVGRLINVLDALGYELDLSIEPKNTPTRANWGPIRSLDPDVRRYVLHARLQAEQAADHLYDQYDLDTVRVIGPLVQSDRTFDSSCTVTLVVEDLEEACLYRSECYIERTIGESDPPKVAFALRARPDITNPPLYDRTVQVIPPPS